MSAKKKSRARSSATRWGGPAPFTAGLANSIGAPNPSFPSEGYQVNRSEWEIKISAQPSPFKSSHWARVSRASMWGAPEKG